VPTSIELKNQESLDLLLESELPVVVDFWAPDCMYCLPLGEIFDALSLIYEHKIVFGKVNCRESSIAAYKDFDVTSIPCIVAFKNKKEINRLVGSHSEEIVKEFIDSIISE